MKRETDFARSLQRYFNEYLGQEKGLSHNTISSYGETFTLYVRYMRDSRKIAPDRLLLADITKDSILDFLQWLTDENAYSSISRNCRLAAFRSFSRYMQYTDVKHIAQWQLIAGISPVRATSRTVEYLSVDAIKLLLSQPDMTTPQGRRHLAILSLMYDSGARVQEVADLTVGSLRTNGENTTLQIIGKGGKARTVPLMTQQVVNLRKYMEENRLTEWNRQTEPLFSNVHGKKLTRAGISHILQVYAAMARQCAPELIPEKISCHTLRHSKAMHLLQAGVNIVNIRDFLGHASIRTTDIYARADGKAKREALEKAYIDTLPEGGPEMGSWEKDRGLLDWLNGLKR